MKELRITMCFIIVLLFSVVLCGVGSSISVEDCPKGLTRDEYLTVFQDKCYYFYLHSKREFQSAQEICQQNGGNLASITTSGVNNFIWKKIKNEFPFNKNVWIGLSDIDEEGKYEWRDGSVMHYDNFESGAGPDTPLLDVSYNLEDCVAMKSVDGEWTDLGCADSFLLNHRHFFVCDYTPNISDEHNTQLPATREDCPSTVRRNKYLQVLDDTCYYFYVNSIKMEFKTAQQNCENYKGNLVSIKSQKVQNFIWRTLNSTYDVRSQVWIGLSDERKEGEFFWRDGSGLDYENFARGEGSTSSQDCVTIDSYTGKWYDQDCEDGWLSFDKHHENYICEFDAEPRTTTTRTTTTATTPKPTTTTTPTTSKKTPPLGDNKRPPAKKRTCPIITLHRDKYLHALDQTCYYFYLRSKVEYQTAQTTCRLHGGNLVSIKSQKVQNFIWNTLVKLNGSNAQVWIGLGGGNEDRTLVWRDGSSMFYSNLAGSQIKYDGQDCVALHASSGKWYFYDCKDQAGVINHRSFICEYPTTTQPATRTTTPVPLKPQSTITVIRTTTTITAVTSPTKTTTDVDTTATQISGSPETTTTSPSISASASTTAPKPITTTKTTTTTKSTTATAAPTKITSTTTPPATTTTQTVSPMSTTPTPHTHTRPTKPKAPTTTMKTTPTSTSHRSTGAFTMDTTTGSSTGCPPCTINDCGDQGYTVKVVGICIICECKRAVLT